MGKHSGLRLEIDENINKNEEPMSTQPLLGLSRIRQPGTYAVPPLTFEFDAELRSRVSEQPWQAGYRSAPFQGTCGCAFRNQQQTCRQQASWRWTGMFLAKWRPPPESQLA